MEKDALLEIIIHDLKEVEMLAQNVKGDTQLSKAFFKLTRNRINSILEEIEMLEELSSIPEKQSPEQKTVKTAQEAPPAPNALPKQESEQKDLTQPTTPEPQDAPAKSQSVSEPLPEKEVTPASDATPTIEEKEESVTAQKPEEKTKEKNIPVDQEKKTEPKQSAEKKEEKENRVLGEKLIKEKASFNEQIGKDQKTANSKRSFSSPPVTDLKKAMGINDRFFFQRELFGGSAEVMNQTLEQLNQMQGINEAQNFLLTNFNWNPENEALLSFMELVERRYL
jgi:chemotaxis protein histidine kinase CheA